MWFLLEIPYPPKHISSTETLLGHAFDAWGCRHCFVCVVGEWVYQVRVYITFSITGRHGTHQYKPCFYPGQRCVNKMLGAVIS
mmetsp:Transcript_21684/g.50040  ORF Transcript_21684/g.50040 Transcript_21684/m.50040 type:complete len:83 (+) Transcript_21684:210-458(+)